jgi:uncharacterized alpha-E superfamily protein
MLLSRVAEQLYWSARYLERAEDTARIVRSFTELIVDLPRSVMTSWEPLLAIAGSRDEYDARYRDTTERSIVHFLVSDEQNPGSVFSGITACRENLRSCREVVPRPAWLVINDLQLSMGARIDDVARRSRSRFLDRVLADGQRFDGIIAGMMPRDPAYEFLRIGKLIERADMTTRVLGVRAADLARRERDTYADVQWMGLLRSLSAMQAFQRTSNTAMDGDAAMRFLLHDSRFPRSVASCATELRLAIWGLPNPNAALQSVDALDDIVEEIDVESLDPVALDQAMDQIQLALNGVHQAVFSAYVHGPGTRAPDGLSVGGSGTAA